jgi:translation initiation factor 3 subunit I
MYTRPFAGHERSSNPATFLCSEDHIINVWFSHKGEHLGTYDRHSGTL